MFAQERKTLYIIVLSICLALLVVYTAYLFFAWGMPITRSEVLFQIKKGESLKSITRNLQTKNVTFTSRSALILLARIRGQEHRIKIGEYRLSSGINSWQFLNAITSGRTIQYPVTLIEGWTFKEFLYKLHNTPKLKATLKGLTQRQVMQKLGYPGQHPEGRFFPDTYHFGSGIDDVTILRQAYRKMSKNLHELWPERDTGIPIKTPYEALILASIIEKETGRASERRTISAVFINRLRIGMRLQTDPTVIYGMGKKYDGNIRLRDLRTDTPYNTYTRYGLPPTPIAMPGRESIYAALHPSDSKAIYFVGRGDGSHQFSRTLREHNKAVIKYQLGGRPRSWPSHSGKKRK